jgi:signal recognition particle subunit SRP54
MQAMGGMSGLMGLLPGVAKMKNQLASANIDERMIKRQVAIIDSMTPRERRHPDILKHSRKKRIAAGSGTRAEDINKLLKMHRTMADMMKAMGSGKRGALAGLGQMLGLGSAMPSPEEMKKLAEKMSTGAGGLPPNMPGMPQLPPNFPGTAPGGLPGLGGSKFPGLPGLPGGKKK